MKSVKSVFVGFLLICSIGILVTACASSRRGIAYHTFDFDLRFDRSDAEILDYQYGSEGQFSTYFDKERISLGQTIRSHGTSGAMPRGEFLYVKWRNMDTKVVYEDRVDLRKLLPADMTNFGIYLFIKGPQLYVYLIPPPGVFPSTFFRDSATPGEKKWIKNTQIYPAGEH